MIVYRIHWHNEGEVWLDDEVYSSETEAENAGEEGVLSFRNDPGLSGDLWFTIEEEEKEDEE